MSAYSVLQSDDDTQSLDRASRVPRTPGLQPSPELQRCFDSIAKLRSELGDRIPFDDIISSTTPSSADEKVGLLLERGSEPIHQQWSLRCDKTDGELEPEPELEPESTPPESEPDPAADLDPVERGSGLDVNPQTLRNNLDRQFDEAASTPCYDGSTEPKPNDGLSATTKARIRAAIEDEKLDKKLIGVIIKAFEEEEHRHLCESKAREIVQGIIGQEHTKVVATIAAEFGESPFDLAATSSANSSASVGSDGLMGLANIEELAEIEDKAFGTESCWVKAKRSFLSRVHCGKLKHCYDKGGRIVQACRRRKVSTQWFMHFAVNVVFHLFPPCCIWQLAAMYLNRDECTVRLSNKCYNPPHHVKKERMWVLLSRQVVVLGGYFLFAQGYLPSFGKHDVMINTFMWFFVILLHSWHETILTELPSQFLDTVWWWYPGGAIDSRTELANAISFEMENCFDGLRNLSSNKLAHLRQDAKRKSDLRSFDIRGATFDVFHADDLEEVLCHQLFGPIGNANAFDDIIVRLEDLLPRGWCPQHNPQHHKIVPDRTRKAVSMVRRHAAELQQMQFGKDHSEWAGNYAILQSRLKESEEIREKAQKLLWEGQRRLEKEAILIDRSVCYKLRHHYQAYIRDAAVDHGIAILIMMFGIGWCFLQWKTESYLFSSFAEGRNQYLEKAFLVLMVGTLVPGLDYFVLPWVVQSWKYTLALATEPSRFYYHTSFNPENNPKTKEQGEFEDLFQPQNKEEQTRPFEDLLELSENAKVQIPCGSERLSRHGLCDLNFARALEIKQNLLHDHLWEEPLKQWETALKSKRQDAESDQSIWKELGIKELCRGNDIEKKAAMKSIVSSVVVVERWWQQQQEQARVTKESEHKSGFEDHELPLTIDTFCAYCAEHEEWYTGPDDVKEAWAALSLCTEATRELTRNSGKPSKTPFKEFDVLAERQIANESLVLWNRIRLVRELKRDEKSSTPWWLQCDEKRNQDLLDVQIDAETLIEATIALADILSKRYYTKIVCVIGIVAALVGFAPHIVDLYGQCFDEVDHTDSHGAANKSTSSATWICVPRNMSANVTLVHGVCQNHMQPSCADWTADASLLEWNDACEHRRYNFNTSVADPCGPCKPRLFVYQTCAAGAKFEWLASVLYSLAGFELTFTIFLALADVLRGFCLRELAVRYLLEMIPHHGTQSHQQQPTFGLLPKFDLDRMGNIVAWNRMRIVLQTWDSRMFRQEQRRGALVVLLLFVVLASAVYTWLAPSDWDWKWQQSTWSPVALLPRRFTYIDVVPKPALTSIRLKAILLQLLGSGLTFHVVWTGGIATRLYEYELPHALLLKKADLQVVGLPTVKPLMCATQVELEIWCRVANGGCLRTFLVENGLHSVVARAAGCSTAHLGISIFDHRDESMHRFDRQPRVGSPQAKRREERAEAMQIPATCNDLSRHSTVQVQSRTCLRLTVILHEGAEIGVTVHELDETKEKKFDDVAKDEIFYMNKLFSGSRKQHLGPNEQLQKKLSFDSSGRQSQKDNSESPHTPTRGFSANKRRHRHFVHLERVEEEEQKLLKEEQEGVQQCIALLDTIIEIMTDERENEGQPRTVEDTRPHYHLPNVLCCCCCNFCRRVRLSKGLQGTILTVIATGLSLVDWAKLWSAVETALWFGE